MLYSFRKLILIKLSLATLFLFYTGTAFSEEAKVTPRELFYQSLELNKQGRLIEAVDKLEQLNKLDPNNPNVIANLAQFSGNAGLYKKAVKYNKKLMQLEPDNVYAEVGVALYSALILTKENKYEEAIVLLESVVTKAPRPQSILWNLALIAAKAEKFDKAIINWKKLSIIEPNNMHLQSKIIQAYQGINDLSARDKGIVKIMDMYKNNIDPNFIKKNMFCREQYKIDNWTVLVFQYFDAGEKNKLFYRYSVADSRGKEKFWLSLGSYQSTTEISREIGDITSDERMYHLDYYDKKMHSTHGMYRYKPSYDDLAQVARDAIKKYINKR